MTGGMVLRKLGVNGKNAPTKKSKTVTASDFAIGGLIAEFERKFLVSFPITRPEELTEIFLNNIDETVYGSDVLNSFFSNLRGTDATIYVKSHVGNDGTVVDAVVANVAFNDQTNPAFKGESAYKGNLSYGVGGNRIGYQIENVNRFETTLSSNIIATDTVIPVDSVIGFRVGDIIEGVINATVYGKVLSIDENAKTITLTAQIGDTGTLGEPINVRGFRIKTYYKSITGIETEVEVELGKKILSPEPEVTEFYINNVHSENKFAKWSKVSSASTLNARFPSNVTTTTFFTSGADGTTPTTSAHWSFNLSSFDNKPVRMIANAETSSFDVNQAGEVYCGARQDTPVWLTLLPENQSKSQLITLGNNYQRSGFVFQVNVAEWLEIQDSFNTAPNSPSRVIPNVGAVMATTFFITATKGIHYIPAVEGANILGVRGLANSNLGENTSDEDRTELAESGINIIQFIIGEGNKIRNFFTASTDEADRFFNGVFMRNFIKISSEDSLQSSENTPNAISKIKSDRDAIFRFMNVLWRKGSTGNVPEGETFGQQENADGTLSKPSDHFQVVADAINNPQSQVNDGNRTLDTTFTFPTPAGSIEINVGILLR